MDDQIHNSGLLTEDEEGAEFKGRDARGWDVRKALGSSERHESLPFQNPRSG